MAKPKPKPKRAKVEGQKSRALGVLAGAAALGLGAGIVVERVLIGRSRLRPDPYANEPYGELKADRSYDVAVSGGATLHVHEMGPSEAQTGAVFLHGYCLDHSIWHHQMKDLSSLARKFVFYDARHHGRSSGGEEVTEIPLLAQDLRSVVKAAGLDRYVLVGHSMGGMTVLEYCRQYPEEQTSGIAGLVLVNTTYTDAIRTIVAADIIGPLDRRLRWVLERVFESPRSANVVRLRGGDLSYLLVKLFGFGSDASVTQVEHIRKLLASFPSPGLVDTLRGIRAFEYEEALAKLTVPTLIIAGGDDRITSVKASERMAEEIASSRLVVFADTGHTGMMERSVEFDALLDEMFEEVLPVGPAARPPR